MFSVAIPVFNHARYVEAAVRSALQSSLVSEVVMVDDGSWDGSADIITRLATTYRDRVRDLTVAGEPNLGAHHRLNQLCQSAASEWIAILNSDDEFTAGRFDILRMIIRTMRSQFICGSLLLINDNGESVGTKRGVMEPEYDLPQEQTDCDPVTTTDLRRLLCNQNFIATTSNMTFHRDLYRRVGGFMDFRYVHDWDFALRATMLGKCSYTANPLTRYRTHSENTIKEVSPHVDGEVVRMIARLVEDFPEIERDSICRHALNKNRHLGRYVPPERLGRQVANSRTIPVITVPADAVQAFGRVTLPGCVVAFEATTNGPPQFPYHHHPTDAVRLPQRAIDGAAFCLAHFDYDFVLVSEALDELPSIRITSPRDAAIFNGKAAGLFMRGETPAAPLTGRLMRLQPAIDERACELDIRDLPGFADARFEGAEIFFGPYKRAVAAPLPVSEADIASIPHGNPSHKVRVIVLPIFLAVGGVERNLVEIIRVLRERYEFLVITTERLAKHQGSLHFQLDDLGIQTIDLAEIGDREHHVTLLETICRAYPPDLVWICNGSPWLAHSAEELRRIFSHTPIVDQQVYDTEHGWITGYVDRGIQSFDRFIAVNSRIRDKFLYQFRIPIHRVDLIYSSVNAMALRRARLAKGPPEVIRSKLGIPCDVLCFAFIGRLADQKRPLDYLELARMAKVEGLDDHFLLVGSGELSGDCERFLAEYQLHNVTHIPFFDPLSDVINSIDGVVVTSVYEGLPIALLETLCLGKPALATDVGDIRLVLEQYGSGKVVSSVGDPDALWSAFIEWRSDLAKYCGLAEQSVEAVLDRFSSKTVGKQYETSWQTAMKEYAPIRARKLTSGKTRSSG